MNITVIGCGYLGAVHACAMAELGHRVVGVDVDRDKVESLAEGRAPFHEPGFTEILRRRIEAGGLTFTTDFSAICGAQAHFVAVGTPQGPGGAADLTHVEAAVEAMKPYLGRCVDGAEIVVGKSTVPVGTAARLAAHRLLVPGDRQPSRRARRRRPPSPGAGDAGAPDSEARL